MYNASGRRIRDLPVRLEKLLFRRTLIWRELQQLRAIEAVLERGFNDPLSGSKRPVTQIGPAASRETPPR
jgi:hypothetical protein